MLPSLLYAPTDTLSLAITGIQLLNLGAFANEMKSPTPYSKFAEKTAASGGAMIPSRQGMLLIYVPAMLTSAACLATAPAIGNGREILVGALLLAHFAKRVFETLFVHVYSGSTSAPVAGFIGVYYALIALLISSQQNHVPAGFYATVSGDASLVAGLAAFAVGQAGNFYHHYRLAAMRREPHPQGAKYVVPTGGMFELVTMPHYTFEIFAWFGIALCCQQLNAVLVALGMGSYLSGRAVATTAWYKERFGKAWPEERRHLVPYVF